MPGDTFMGSQGNNYAYNSMTFAENEERSPWEPLHVQHGFKPTDSAVSVFSGCRSTHVYPRRAREILARACAQHAARHRPAISPGLLLDPITARQFIDRGGFDTKDKLIR